MCFSALLRTIDPAVAPEVKEKPKRAIIILLSFVISGIFGMIYVLLANRLSPRSFP